MQSINYYLFITPPSEEVTAAKLTAFLTAVREIVGSRPAPFFPSLTNKKCDMETWHEPNK